MEEGENLSIEELENLEEADIEITNSASQVNEGICEECNEKIIKVVENKSMLDGSITFHIIKLKCPNCGKEYIDLDQAEKYDFLLTLQKAIKQPLNTLTSKISN